MVTATASRVVAHTSPEINRMIERKTDNNIARYSLADDEALTRRICALDREWDIERALELHASSMILAGAVAGLFRGRKWMVVPALAAGFLLQHSLQGWCPAMAVLRRLGLRTRDEIDREKYTLKALRGDYRHMNPDGKMDEIEWSGA